MTLYSIFRTGLEGELPRSRTSARPSDTCLTTSTRRSKIFASGNGPRPCSDADVKARYADLKQASADRCPRLLGSLIKVPEIQFHHDVYNQYLWNQF